MRCPYCKKQCSLRDNICPHCGEPISKRRNGIALVLLAGIGAFLWIFYQAPFIEIKILSITVIVALGILLLIFWRKYF